MTAARSTEELYEELVALSEVSLELVRDAQFEALERVHDACRALVAKLPPVPPATAVGRLQRVAALDAEKRRLLEAQIGFVRDALVKIERGRSALGGYRSGPTATHARIDRTG